MTRRPIAVSLVAGLFGMGSCGGGSGSAVDTIIPPPPPPPQCAQDSECSDALFCNGLERCTDGRCGVGVPPCGAGESCNEQADTCVNLPPTISSITTCGNTDPTCSNSMVCTGEQYCGYPNGNPLTCDERTYTRYQATVYCDLRLSVLTVDPEGATVELDVSTVPSIPCWSYPQPGAVLVVCDHGTGYDGYVVSLTARDPQGNRSLTTSIDVKDNSETFNPTYPVFDTCCSRP
jgi:hypothetical protein